VNVGKSNPIMKRLGLDHQAFPIGRELHARGVGVLGENLTGVDQPRAVDAQLGLIAEANIPR
jgi:hypothetical protein